MPKTLLTLLLLLTAMPLPAAEWKLVGSDECDKPGQPDPAKKCKQESERSSCRGLLGGYLPQLARLPTMKRPLG